MSKLDFLTMDDYDFTGKRVLLRVDMNIPVDKATGRLKETAKIYEHAKTILELVRKKAKVVVLTHQGRPGESDFIPLDQHVEVLSSIISRVKYVKDLMGEEAERSIKELKNGEVLVLENVRTWPEELKEQPPEELAKSKLVQKLAPLFDVFVNDAFGAAHRSQASLVGFAEVLPTVAGRLMEWELKMLVKAASKPEKPSIYILGGVKAEDAVEVCEGVLSRGVADKVLTGGLIASIFLTAKGYRLGEPNEQLIEKKGFKSMVPDAQKLLSRFEGRIVTPVDVAVEKPRGKRSEVKVGDLPVDALIKDVGADTINLYKEELKDAKTVVFSGPLGVFEEPLFMRGTEEILKAMANSKAFTMIGGGHTVAAAKQVGVIDSISYTSTGGGALTAYLTGKELPVVTALRKAALRRRTG
ncbi:MAG: phosphoglycerate kinase [Candidatus Nezhaarchaeales archaeon]